MYGGFIALAVIALAILYSQLTADLRGIAEDYRYKSRIEAARDIAAGVKNYFDESNQLPQNLDQLADAEGYQYLRSRHNPWNAYAVSGTLSDGSHLFERAVIVSSPAIGDLLNSGYMDANGCGTGNALLSVTWCGDSRATWSKIETKADLAIGFTGQRARQAMSLQKFADYYSSFGRFPSSTQAGVIIDSGSGVSLATVVGYTGNAGNCKGPFSFSGIPIDCNEIYDMWGGEITYQFNSTDHMILISRSPVLASDGSPVLIATDFEVRS